MKSRIPKTLKTVFGKYMTKYRHFEYPHFEKNWNSIALQLSEFGGISGGNKVHLYKNQDDVFQDMWKEIDNAKQRVLLETYIFEPDVIGKKFLSKLSDASKRGCEVVLLYDDFGSFGLGDVHIKELKDNGGDVIAFKPLKRSLKKWHNTKIMALLLGRNHRKVLVVDDKIAFCGGMNIGRDYCGTAIGGTDFYRDAHVKLEGPAVGDLIEVFEDSIKEANISYNALAEIIKMKFRGKAKKLPNSIPPNENFDETIVQVLQSNARANNKQIEKGFRIALESCIQSCVITSPYFLPSKPVRDCLIRAAKRGIQIEIITAGRTDVLIAKFASRHIYSFFLKNGIKIYEMKNYALHAKMANIDDLYGYVGSFNMDLLSMNCNMETCLTFMSPEIAGQIKEKFEQYKNESTLITLEDMEKTGYIYKFINWTAFHFVRIYSRVFKTFGLGIRDND